MEEQLGAFEKESERSPEGPPSYHAENHGWKTANLTQPCSRPAQENTESLLQASLLRD